MAVPVFVPMLCEAPLELAVLSAECLHSTADLFSLHTAYYLISSYSLTFIGRSPHKQGCKSSTAIALVECRIWGMFRMLQNAITKICEGSALIRAMLSSDPVTRREALIASCR